MSFSCVFSFSVTFLCTSEGEPSLSFFLGIGEGKGLREVSKGHVVNQLQEKKSFI